MKKTVLTLMIALIVSASFAQTTITISPPSFYGILANKDTVTRKLITTTVVTTSFKYDTLHYNGYLSSKAVTYSGQSNFNISGLAFDGSPILITLNNCSNVHITKCRFSNATSYAIKTYGCTNITIDSNFFTGVAFGIYAQQSKIIKVNANQCLNLKGSGTTVFAHFVQFDNITGGGNRINYNRIENIAGVAINPHDILSVYQSNGLPGDSIQVIGNWIRGGQLALNSTRSNGAAGIVLGDVGGSYQVARGNILVNPGYIGIQIQGTSTHISDRIKVDHNIVYSVQTPVSLLGLASAGIGPNTFVGYNQIQWLDYNGHQDPQWYNGTQPQGVSTNRLNAPISSSILPPVIITMK